MKSVKVKYIVYNCIVVILLCFFYACQNRKSENQKLFYRSNETLIDTLYVADDSTYSPYNFYTKNRNGGKIPAGLLIDVWKLWSKKTGIPVKYQLLTFKDAIKLTESGKVDIVLGICPKYRDSLYNLYYSKPYYNVSGKPIIKKEKEIYFKSLDEGVYTFGVCEGDVAPLIIKNEYKNLETVSFPNYVALVNGLESGKVSGIILEEPIFKYTLFSQNKSSHINDYILLDDNIPMPLHAGSSDKKVLDLVNYGFSKIDKDEIRKIENSWIKRFEPSILRAWCSEFYQWFSNHIGSGILLTMILIIIVFNLYAVFLYIFLPYKLILIEPNVRKLPVINLKIQSFEISISKILFLEIIIFNPRTISSFHETMKEALYNKAVDFLNQRKTDKYLTFPVTIGGESIGYMPLVENNIDNIKKRLKKEIDIYNPVGIIISGSGGIGKTTLCTQIISWYYFDKTFNSKNYILLPINFYWMETGLKQEDFEKKVFEHIRNKFSALFEVHDTDSLFNYFYNDKLIIIVIDSFSEYFSSKKKNISLFIDDWVKSGNHYIITSRSTIYNQKSGGFIEINPQLLTTSFLMNLIEHTIINSFNSSDLSRNDTKRISEIFTILNMITNDNGVTPLFCRMFSEVLYLSPINDFTGQDTPGLYKFFEVIFENYLKEIIRKEEKIDKSDLDEVTKKLIEFASYFAWTQVSINNTYDLNNYLLPEDLNEFSDYENYLKLLLSPGSLVITNSGRLKFKYDPIAEILVSKFLYNRYWNFMHKGKSKELDEEFKIFLDSPNFEETKILLQNLKHYIKDQSTFLNDKIKGKIDIEVDKALTIINQKSQDLEGDVL